MDLKEAQELKRNIELKEEAYEIYNRAISLIELKGEQFDNGRFKIMDDGHNRKYISFSGGNMVYNYEGLHFNYIVVITPESIFNGLKSNYRGVDHLKYGNLK